MTRKTKKKVEETSSTFDKPMMKILGLDISSTCTGITRIELNMKDASMKLESVSHIKPKGKSLYERLKVLDEQMESLGHYDWADLVVIEGFAFGGNAVVQLAQVNGVIRYQLYLRNKEVHDIYPTSVKKFVTGNGKAKKDQVREAIKKIPLFESVSFTNDDESDSAAITYSFIKKTLEEN